LNDQTPAVPNKNLVSRDPARDFTVTLFFPTLNEVNGLKAILPRLKPEWYDELIVVDGGSTDGTVEFLEQQGITAVRQKRNGFSNAYHEGFDLSSGDLFVTFTPDGNCIPELIPNLLETTKEGYDLVFVSRYLPPAKSYDDGRITGFGNWFFAKLINVIFGCNFTDPLGGFRAYRRTAVHRMALNTQISESKLKYKHDLLNTWEVGSIIRAAKLKLKTKEIPGDEPKRIGGESKMSILYNGSMIFGQIAHELISGKRFLK
jgi:glycosyltransferase involved in cell wall biosynthesis